MRAADSFQLNSQFPKEKQLNAVPMRAILHRQSRLHLSDWPGSHLVMEAPERTLGGLTGAPTSQTEPTWCILELLCGYEPEVGAGTNQSQCGTEYW